MMAADPFFPPVGIVYIIIPVLSHLLLFLTCPLINTTKLILQE